MIILLVDMIIGTANGVIAYLLLSWMFSNTAGVIGGIVTLLITVFMLMVMQGAAIASSEYDRLEGRPNGE